MTIRPGQAYLDILAGENTVDYKTKTERKAEQLGRDAREAWADSAGFGPSPSDWDDDDELDDFIMDILVDNIDSDEFDKDELLLTHVVDAFRDGFFTPG